MIKVMLVDHNSLIRHGLQMLLQGNKDMQVHATEPFSGKLQKEIALYCPDIVIFPVDILETAIMEEVRTLREKQPQVKVLMLMSVFEEYFILEGLKAGVEGFLLDESDISKKQLATSIRQLYEGEYVLTGKIAAFAMKKLQDMYDSEKQELKNRLLDHHIEVSWRELDILYLLLKNRKNKEMAVSLNLTEKTIRDYVSSAYKKNRHE
ncbi:response regulator transcription factor [Virgibacillus halophilus]|uniref:Response regulator transcription factor n=1 Tax=Tigheibacillus halophilus TaxID=361280 RepID=A0ABU5C635_9BACI|nr:response regulator transcription factor [Virgibacillus halophilus]